MAHFLSRLVFCFPSRKFSNISFRQETSFYVGLYVAFVEQLGDDGGWYIRAACCHVQLLFAVMLVFTSFFLIFSKGNAEGTNS